MSKKPKKLYVLLYKHGHGEDVYPFYSDSLTPVNDLFYSEDDEEEDLESRELTDIERLLCKLQDVGQDECPFEADNCEESLQLYSFDLASEIPTINEVPAPVWTCENTELTQWFERDRANLRLDCKKTGKTIIDLWDHEVDEMIQDGFVNCKDYHGSLVEYANERKLVARDDA